ncbi:MAG: cofactor-independent phosphoglycerate mutase [Pirellulales bacterium]|nr:cofactor-independent phosphoglycerate mutase [Pirellulales bacterium]
MKYAIIIPDGCADEPQESLDGKTPLEAACLPAIDAVAAEGIVGRATFVPPSLPPGSDVANLGLFGYDPVKYYTGRAPLEAVAQGIRLGPDDWAIRCNLVTIENQCMKSFTAGHISNDEAAALIAAAQEALGSDLLEFHPGVSYRNLLVVRAAPGRPAPFSVDTRTTPPHDLTDKPVIDDYPRGPGSDLLAELMERSMTIFADHPVNVARRAAGKPAATSAWLWGQGQTPRMETFAQLHAKQGAMITAVDLLRGLAALMEWRRIDVPGATGYTDTDYAAKGRAACEALAEVDLVAVHVEAPDEASHEGDVAAKVASLEAIDRHIVGPIHEALRSLGDYRILVTPDHPTPVRTKTHAHGSVPLAMAGQGIQPDAATSYDERTSNQASLVWDEGWRLMSFFLGEGA